MRKIYRNIIIWLTIVSWLTIPLQLPPAFAITVSEEEKLSDKFMREATRQFTFIEDPVLVDYLNSIGKRIGAELPPQPYQFRFFLIQKNGYNAFAGPGGVIFIFSDLLAAMETPGELAGIVAHEMMHVTSRHLSDRIDRSKQIGVVTLAGLVAAIALGAAGGGSAATALAVGSMATGQSMALAYSREDEMQADQLGLKVLTRAGYRPEGLVAVMKKIREKQWYGTREVPTYLRTHPASEERIAYISAWTERQVDLPEAISPQEQMEFDWIRTRVKALYGDKEQEMQFYAESVKKQPMDPLANYGYGLILARSGRFTEAAGYLKNTLAQRAFDSQLLIDLGRVYFQGGQFSESLKILESAMAIDAHNSDGLYYLGRTHLAKKKPAEAIAVFKKLVKVNPNHRDLMYFIGQAHGQLGNMAEAHYHLGRYHHQRGKVDQAIVQLEKALALANTIERKGTIEALLETLREEQAHQRKNKPE